MIAAELDRRVPVPVDEEAAPREDRLCDCTLSADGSGIGDCLVCRGTRYVKANR